MTIRKRTSTTSTLLSTRRASFAALVAAAVPLCIALAADAGNEQSSGEDVAVLARFHSRESPDASRAEAMILANLDRFVPLLIESYRTRPNSLDLSLLILVKDLRVRPLVVQALASDDFHLRHYALRGLAAGDRFLDPASIPLLVSLVKEAKDGEERNDATRALANQIGNGILPLIFESKDAQSDYTKVVSILHLARYSPARLHVEALARGSDAEIARAILLLHCVRYPTPEAIACLDKLISGELAPKYKYSPANLKYCRQEAAKRLARVLKKDNAGETPDYAALYKQFVEEEHTFQVLGKTSEDLEMPDLQMPRMPTGRVNQGSHLTPRGAKSEGK